MTEVAFSAVSSCAATGYGDPIPDATSPEEPATVRAGAARMTKAVRFGRCEVRPGCREVLVDGRLRPLQPRAFDVLVYLIENGHRVVPTDELLDRVWNGEMVQQGSLAAAVMRIRKALREREIGSGTLVRTYARVGYRFVAELDAGSVQGEPA